MQNILVLKVGTHAITRDGLVDVQAIKQLVDGVIDLLTSGSAVVLVSSGAVSAGIGLLGQLAADVGEVARRQVRQPAKPLSIESIISEAPGTPFGPLGPPLEASQEPPPSLPSSPCGGLPAPIAT